MGKIGRNEPCPCGSGVKYKKCCLYKTADKKVSAPDKGVRQVSLREEIEKVQQEAEEGRDGVKTVGVFIFFSTVAGDAWLLEVSEMDAVMLAAKHERLEVSIDENQATIEVEWSHVFEIRDDKFVVTAYKDKKVDTFEDYPAREIRSAIKKIKRKFSSDQLNKVHIQKQANSNF